MGAPADAMYAFVINSLYNVFKIFYKHSINSYFFPVNNRIRLVAFVAKSNFDLK